MLDIRIIRKLKYSIIQLLEYSNEKNQIPMYKENLDVFEYSVFSLIRYSIRLNNDYSKRNPNRLSQISSFHYLFYVSCNSCTTAL